MPKAQRRAIRCGRRRASREDDDDRRHHRRRRRAPRGRIRGPGSAGARGPARARCPTPIDSAVETARLRKREDQNPQEIGTDRQERRAFPAAVEERRESARDERRERKHDDRLPGRSGSALISQFSATVALSHSSVKARRLLLHLLGREDQGLCRLDQAGEGGRQPGGRRSWPGTSSCPRASPTGRLRRARRRGSVARVPAALRCGSAPASSTCM